MTKICTKCLEDKDVASFSKDKQSKDGFKTWCKKCCQEYSTKRREDPQWLEHLRLYRIAYSLSLSEEDKERRRQEAKDRSIKNRDRNTERMREYRRKNPEKFAEYRKKYYPIQRADVNFKLGVSLRVRLNMAIKNNQKSGSAVDDLGCSVTELKAYLEAKFQPGMTWDNWGRGEGKWHIDHIIPLSAFNLEDRQHFILACYYMNLQPMWERENFSKGDTYPTFDENGLIQ